MARKIVITSGKGGVGKTTIVATLGKSLASKNKKVLLIDADIGLNNLDVVLGVEDKVVYDLVDAVNGKCRVKQAIIECEALSNLYVLPSNKVYFNIDINGEQLKLIIDELNTYYDYILIDCPAGMEMGFYRAIQSANEAIVVTTSSLSAVRDAYKIINLLQSNGKFVSGVVLNRVRGDLVLQNEMISEKEVEKYLRIPVLGVIPDDANLNIAEQCAEHNFNKRKPECLLAVDYLSNYLIDGKVMIYDYTKKYKGILGAIKRRIKRWV